MKTNAAGKELICRNEGCELTAYVCSAGKLTIGFGDTGPHVYEGMTITREEAEELLANRLEREFERGVLDVIGDAPTNENQFAAMVSLAYNIGVGGFRRSTVARKHCEGDYETQRGAGLDPNETSRLSPPGFLAVELGEEHGMLDVSVVTR